MNDTSVGIASKVFQYPTSAAHIEEELNKLLTPQAKTCGKEFRSACAAAAKVWQLGSSDTFAIFFVGERLNEDVQLDLDSSGLINFSSETFNNRSHDILHMNSDVAYTNVDVLYVYMGHEDTLSNIRGTSAETFIVTQEGDDTFFLSSDANEVPDTADLADILLGHLDYLEKDLHIITQDGRHRLFMSDTFSAIPKGVGSAGHAVLSKDSLLNLSDDLGNIYFSTNGNWFGDLTLWLGTSGDYLDVNSVPSTQSNRTTTTVHAGSGDDVVNINLDGSNHEGSPLFVANGQDGNDVLDASGSTLPVILIGDGGSDKIYGGGGEDVLFGDYGLVSYIDEDGNEVARIGGGGYGDSTDNVIRSVHRIQAVYPPFSTNNFGSGNDTVYGNGARDILFGCGGNFDKTFGNDGNDIIFGDFGEVILDVSAPSMYGVVSIDSLNCTEGGGMNTVIGGMGDGK